MNTQWFNQVLQAIAIATGAGKDKIILIVLDQARWHTSKTLEIPEGILLEILAHRCCILSNLTQEISALTNYHWWPDPEQLGEDNDLSA